MGPLAPLLLVALVALMRAQAVLAAPVIAPGFSGDYVLFDLGPVPGVPVPYGGLTTKFDDPDTLQAFWGVKPSSI